MYLFAADSRAYNVVVIRDVTALTLFKQANFKCSLESRDGSAFVSLSAITINGEVDNVVDRINVENPGPLGK